VSYDLDGLEWRLPLLDENGNTNRVEVWAGLWNAMIHDLRVLRELRSPEMQGYTDEATENYWGYDLVKEILREAERRVEEASVV